jgi:hypothetical protein
MSDNLIYLDPDPDDWDDDVERAKQASWPRAIQRPTGRRS